MTRRRRGAAVHCRSATLRSLTSRRERAPNHPHPDPPPSSRAIAFDRSADIPSPHRGEGGTRTEGVGGSGGRADFALFPEANAAAEAPPHLPIADALGPFLSPRGEEERHVVAQCDSPAPCGGGMGWGVRTELSPSPPPPPPPRAPPLP